VLIDVILVALVLLVAIIVITGISHIRTSTPYGGTSRAAMDVMFSLADLRPGETFVDIGAGDGRLLFEAKRRCPECRARGYEVALGVWLVGRVRLLLSRTDARLLLRDALKADLRDADVIALYMAPEMMAKLQPVLDRQLRPGTRVIASVFRFHDREPVSEREIPGRPGKKVRLYRW